MCDFLSIVCDGKNCYMFRWAERKKILKGKLYDSNGNPITDADSHTSIAVYSGFEGADEDDLSKWEYDPFVKDLWFDGGRSLREDRPVVQAFVDGLDIADIVPALIVKPIVNPFVIRKRKRVTQVDTDLLHQWARLPARTRRSASERIKKRVGLRVYSAVDDRSVFPLVYDMVTEVSASDTFYESVSEFIDAYITSFFNLWPKGNPYQPAIDLWERGLVASYGGTTWRLHGAGGKEIYNERTRR